MYNGLNLSLIICVDSSHCLLITNCKSLLMMFRIFQFINHGGGIIFNRDMAVSYNIYNHIIFPNR